MHLILTGATGLVGSAALRAMLTTKEVTRISILSRRPVPMAEGHDDKVKVLIQEDFATYDRKLLDQLSGAQGCVWALGVSATNVNRSDYTKITHDYPLAAARAFSTLSPTFTFLYISGEGATTTPGYFTPFFGRIKGAAEAGLLSLHNETPSLRPYSLRPGFVDAVDQPDIHPFIPTPLLSTRVLSVVLGPVLRGLWKSQVSPTRELGSVMVELAMSPGERLEGGGVDGEGRTISNKGFRRIAGI